MNIYKLIKDIKSEIPESMMTYKWETLNAFFNILCWKDFWYPNKDREVRKFARAFFEFICGEPYETNDWLDRVYQIIDGKLNK